MLLLGQSDRQVVIPTQLTTQIKQLRRSKYLMHINRLLGPVGSEFSAGGKPDSSDDYE